MPSPILFQVGSAHWNAIPARPRAASGLAIEGVSELIQDKDAPEFAVTFPPWDRVLPRHEYPCTLRELLLRLGAA